MGSAARRIPNSKRGNSREAYSSRSRAASSRRVTSRVSGSSAERSTQSRRVSTSRSFEPRASLKIYEGKSSAETTSCARSEAPVRTRSSESSSRARSEVRSAASKPKRAQGRAVSKGSSKRSAAHVNTKAKASTKAPRSAKPKDRGSFLGAILIVPAAIASLFKKGSASAAQPMLGSRKRFASLSPAKLTAIGVLLVLAIGVALVYPAGKNYYVAVRTYDRSQAELSAITDRNVQLQDRIDTLKTKAGMEDYVRAQYGWTKNKENAVRVTGLPASTNTFELPANVPAGSVVAEDSFWNDVLDAIFFVKDDVPTASDTTLTNSTRKLTTADEAAEGEQTEEAAEQAEAADGENAPEGSADEQPAT
ncbi:MAG: hypothetical protein K6G78_03945 [bacterium]|nr:hypothetical protein [bacterium]